MKTILLAAAVVLGGLQSAWSFSLAGPVGNGGDSWQTADIGYGPPTSLVGPKNLGEEFRRNIPVYYYAFNQNFLDYFGSNGVTAVDQAFAILNNLTNVSSYSANLAEFPLDSRHVNFQAQALGLFDLKSWTLGIMVEQVGLTDPVEWTWTLHDRYLLPGSSCPPGMEYLVVQRNFDYVSSPLNQLQYSAYVNDTLYSYQIVEDCVPPNPVALAVPFSVDPLADTYSPVASLSGLLSIGWGDFYTGLTRDDIAGLKYLIQTNNINRESVETNSTLFNITTNLSSQQLFPNTAGTNFTGTNSAFYYYDGTYGYGDLRGLLSTASTNNPATLSALYPGLVISSATNYFVIASNATVVSYFTNGGIGSPYGSVRLVTATNYTLFLQEKWNYKFANVFTNRYYSKSVSVLQSITVAPAVGSPYTGAYVTNTTSQTLTTTNFPSGDFFVLTLFQTNGCPLSILYTGLTNVTATTNFITGTSTNVVTATNISSFSFSQILITYFTNYTFVINPVTCAQVPAPTGLYQGIENIKYVKSSFDSLLGQFFQPITNNYSMVFVTNSQARVQHFQRVVTTPDFLFDAQDLAAGNGGIPLVATFSRNLNFDTANVLPGLAGPGTITTPTEITFEKVGPVFFNATLDTLDGTSYFTQTPGGDITNLFYGVYFVWASYDGTTNAPVVYPNGTSIDNLENQVLINVTPATVPNGFNGFVYPTTTFAATGGAFTAPYTWSAANLPDGLSLSSDGTLSGVPTTSGTFTFTLTLTDYIGRSVQWNYSITIQ